MTFIIYALAFIVVVPVYAARGWDPMRVAIACFFALMFTISFTTFLRARRRRG